MKRLISIIAFAGALAVTAGAVTIPNAGEKYKIRSISGLFVTVEDNTLKLQPEKDGDSQEFTAISTGDGVWNLRIADGKLAGANNKWNVAFLDNLSDPYAQFRFETTIYPGYVTIRNLGNKCLGTDSPAAGSEIWTDKAGDSDLHRWALVAVKGSALEKITLSNETLALNVKGNLKATLKVTLAPAGVDEALVWSSSDTGVARVDMAGTVYAVAPGEAEIKAEAYGKSAVCKVTIAGNPDPYEEMYIPDSDPRANVYPGYKLVFAQEFSTPGLPDADVWNFEDGYMRNHEDQYYSQREENPNAYVRDGVLVIEAREEAIRNKHYTKYGTSWQSKKGQYTKYTSASLTSKGGWNDGFTWLYGIYEIRAKIPAYTGTWPAIWSTGRQYEWPYGGEIDILEWYGDRIHANVCVGNGSRWGADWRSRTVHKSSLGDGWGDEYHIWKMVWEYDRMQLWCDDILVNDIDLETTYNKVPADNFDHGNGCNPFRDVRQMMWLNLALGGDNGGSLANTPMPCRYLVDYVRVYQRPGIDGKAAYKVDETTSEPTFDLHDGEAGVENITDSGLCDAAAPRVYYSLQGIALPSPRRGEPVIWRQGAHSGKIIF